MASQNINISFKRKQSISSNGASAMSYSPSSHTMPALFQHRDSFVHQRELESAFCSDLVCCGTRVKDLHELLHHYEEHHHAPIEEEPEPKEGEGEDDVEDDVMMEGVEAFSTTLPTQPHELAALTSSPLIRKNNEVRVPISVGSIPSPMDSTIASEIISSPIISQHTEDILKQALPALLDTSSPTAAHESLHYFRSEALYQTCDDGQDKPYKCPVEGCDKAYKNPNGLKYHQMHGHSEEDTLSEAERDAQKPYMCTIGYCNKRYKNLNGLKYHIEHSHIAKLKQVPFVSNSVSLLSGQQQQQQQQATEPWQTQQQFRQ
ncbi:hypothetical protein [Parasitella parasitica]|uniref:C2H2-type domain-containing protein n=1 Tax=Parasitella parasitica TaxID=35722 RepID=A0A0B7NRI6_9FUNG|nr:hypothetical protein [Parasitella parasitica]